MSEESQRAGDIEAGQEWQVHRFTPQDAAGVVSLFHSVYGEGYPVPTYLDAKLLIAENDAGRTISSVAKTPRGEVVGHNALFNSAPHSGTYESGAGVVHAAYRGGKGIFTEMVSHGEKLAREMVQVETTFGEAVCNHPFSQKLSLKLGYVARALEVDLMPSAAYEKEASAAGRVAAFVDSRVVRGKAHTVYLPAMYEDDLGFFYADFGDDRDFRTSEVGIPAESVTDMRPQVFSFAAVARVAIPVIGADFAARLDALENDLQAKGVLVNQLWLNLACPWVGAAVELLRERGYFIGGALPRWFDTDGMLMQKIHKRPDWEGICTVSERGAEILNRVRADWQRTQG